VKGEEDKNLYSGVKQEGIYNPEGGTIQTMPNDEVKKEVNTNKTLAEKIESGNQIYTKTCFACHQANGEGIANAFPPLANSDYLNEDVKRAIAIVLHGKTGEITVNGAKYNSIMTKQTLTDDEIADVLTYVYNSWGNNKSNVTATMVAEVKSSH
jgi:nitrite reductase (NO-forming)